MTLDELEKKLERVPTGLLKKLIARREGNKVAKAKPRYEILGVWERTGDIHLRYYTDLKKYADDIKVLHHITFGDGTQLTLQVREMGYGEKKQITKTSYKNLVEKCLRYETNSVDEATNAFKQP